jgi:hypothetical protein
VFAVALSAVFSLSVYAQTVGASLENEHLRVTFDEKTGSLTGFRALATGHEFIGENNGGLWEIETARGQINPAMAGAFHWRRGGEKGDQLELEWTDFAPVQMQGLRVTATLALAGDEPSSHWQIALDGIAALSPTSVRFPRISSITAQENEVLAVPVWMGERTRRARDLLCGESGGRFEWEYPGTLSMQCMTLYRKGGAGLYLFCDDTGAQAKRFAVFGKKDRSLGFELTQLMKSGADGADAYRSPYKVALGAFEGDWFTVARRYRDWGLKQSWAQESRLKTGVTPEWLTETGLWVWNRGRSGGVLPPALALQSRAQIPVSVFWHWWHGCAYDAGFPEYLPPREGAEAFQAALKQAQDNGLHAIVYMNQRLWGMTAASWTTENAERFAVKGRDGKVAPEVYNTFMKVPCASMCMGTSFWRDKYAGIASEVIMKLGVDGIYMDQACSSLACFDPAHGHPLGGGSYWMNGFRLLQADIRERCGTRKVTLAGEGCGETWLPYLDAMLSLQVSMERYAAPGDWEPIPFFHAVYHGYGVFYGNYSSLAMPPYDDLWPAEYAPKEPLKTLDRKYSGQFRLEQARAFAWGQQPTLANFLERQFEECSSELAYVQSLAKLRYDARKYLLHGTMLSVFDDLTTSDEIDFSRLSIYAGQQEDRVKEYRKMAPTVLATAWRAPDGDVAVVVVNITNRPQAFDLKLDAAQYGIADGSTISVRTIDGVKPLDKVLANGIDLRIELAEAAACVYEFTSKK